MLQVVRVVVHGIFIRPSELAILILYNAFDNFFLLEAADKWSTIPLLLCRNARLAQLRRLRLQFQSVFATLRAFDAEKKFHLLHQHLFYPGII